MVLACPDGHTILIWATEFKRIEGVVFTVSYSEGTSELRPMLYETQECLHSSEAGAVIGTVWT